VSDGFKFGGAEPHKNQFSLTDCLVNELRLPASSDAITALVCALVVRLENNSPSKKIKIVAGLFGKLFTRFHAKRRLVTR
jgi:hypothetical protein